MIKSHIFAKKEYISMTEKTELDKKWQDLHKEIVDKIVRFCKENGVNEVTDVNLHIDCMDASISYGQWTAATDSSFTAYDCEEDNVILFSI